MVTMTTTTTPTLMPDGRHNAGTANTTTALMTVVVAMVMTHAKCESFLSFFDFIIIIIYNDD